MRKCSRRASSRAQEYEQVAVNYENGEIGRRHARRPTSISPSRRSRTRRSSAPQEGTVIDEERRGRHRHRVGDRLGERRHDDRPDGRSRHVRIRALFNETDIGNVHPGEPANVTVDAYPDRRFSGVVEKIEPQAVIQQNVTMFPVLVNLQNGEGLLKPGMNGEVSVLIDERDDVLAIPNDAIKNAREAVATGAMLGLSADSVNRRARGAGLHGGGNRGGFGGGRRRRQRRQRWRRRRSGGGAGGGGAGSADGDVALMDASAQPTAQARSGLRQGGGGRSAASRCPTPTARRSTTSSRRIRRRRSRSTTCARR